MKPHDCPCHSGHRYKTCCGPLHDGAVAKSPEALMRSRYAAFALRLHAYLVDTLAEEHEDRGLDRASLIARLAGAHGSPRFMGLDILDTGEDGDTGWVTFHARIFEKGRDRSMTERSTFVRVGGHWRYLSGVILSSALTAQ